ncbi:MAG TPA: L-threonylcarbamoyladenylate synthase [Candidatus Atribacteria bacterium]|nr:L-threonylcarbamoyladenylate synthase [Candidatus Atribacteria bacterium]
MLKIKTRILTIEDIAADKDKIEAAAKLLRDGEVVAFPTETVYGLGANALDPEAVKKIFTAKGRPGDNPLIVHIADIGQWSGLAEAIPESAQALARAFWPGPLTIILKKREVVPHEVTAGLDTVAVRMPSHPVARSLIAAARVPIAAPSANFSGRPSPTTARHVLEDLEGRIPLILDGGRADVGAESTVVDMAREVPVLLRPGGITREMLEQVLGRVEVDPGIMSPIREDRPVPSPGMKYKHYAPKAPVTVFRGSEDRIRLAIDREARRQQRWGKKVGILATDDNKDFYTAGIVRSMGSRARPADLAASLFALLREFDELGVDTILAEGVDPHDEGLAVMNRLARAAGFHFIDV